MARFNVKGPDSLIPRVLYVMKGPTYWKNNLDEPFRIGYPNESHFYLHLDYVIQGGNRFSRGIAGDRIAILMNNPINTYGYNLIEHVQPGSEMMAVHVAFEKDLASKKVSPGTTFTEWQIAYEFGKQDC